MVVPNLPRFIRENDKSILKAKIVNMSSESLNGSAKLEFINPYTMENITNKFSEENVERTFKVEKGESTAVEWSIGVPEGFDSIIVRITAGTENYSDGEEKVLLVLKDSMLVTETMPVFLKGGEQKNIYFDKLINSAKSDTLRNYSYSFEYTSNPAWYAVQALPYLMEYPYECREQIFNRYYSNAIAADIVKENPKIENIFEA